MVGSIISDKKWDLLNITEFTQYNRICQISVVVTIVLNCLLLRHGPYLMQEKF